MESGEGWMSSGLHHARSLFQLPPMCPERPLAGPQVLVAAPSQGSSFKSVAADMSWARCAGRAWEGSGAATATLVLSGSVPAVAVSNSRPALAA